MNAASTCEHGMDACRAVLYTCLRALHLLPVACGLGSKGAHGLELTELCKVPASWNVQRACHATLA